MKLTAKLAKFSFDQRYFIETLDHEKKGKLKIKNLLKILNERFNLYLSENEKKALLTFTGLQSIDSNLLVTGNPS